MPEMDDSMAAVISPVLRLTSRLAFFILTRCVRVNHTLKLSTRQRARASFQLIDSITAKEPRKVRPQISRFSGPWWLSSVTSKRSEVIWLIKTPVRCRSK